MAVFPRRCYLCDRRLRPNQRITEIWLFGADGEPKCSYVLHEFCKDELVSRNPDLYRHVPEVDLDAG